MKGLIMVTINDVKWHELKMKCVNEGCPTIHVQPGRGLSDVLRDVCNITCKTHMSVITDFQGGFVIPADTGYYDAFFMAMEQTNKDSPQARLDEARMIKEAVPDFKFDEDLKMSLAYYRAEVLKENPKNVEQFTEEDVVDTYDVLSKMKNTDYKATLLVLKKELHNKYPNAFQKLEQKTQNSNNPGGITR